MAPMTGVTVPVYLRVGGTLADEQHVGTMDLPVKVKLGPITEGAVSASVRVDDITPHLAAFLRALADRLDSPGTGTS